MKSAEEVSRLQDYVFTTLSKINIKNITQIQAYRSKQKPTVTETSWPIFKENRASYGILSIAFDFEILLGILNDKRRAFVLKMCT